MKGLKICMVQILRQIPWRQCQRWTAAK
uniref:Uncharacterized protein n=1 Tax=Anguilla anguilla TaxID=7936 RepID=A0A0E9TM79_ANGAN